MVCIYCNSKTAVTNSRSSQKNLSTWRRRQCETCHAIFTTRETPDLYESLRVNNSQKALQPFSRDKVMLSVYLSILHRKTALDDSTALIGTILPRVVAHSNRGVIDSKEIFEITLGVLTNFDKAGATYYQAHNG